MDLLQRREVERGLNTFTISATSPSPDPMSQQLPFLDQRLGLIAPVAEPREDALIQERFQAQQMV